MLIVLNWCTHRVSITQCIMHCCLIIPGRVRERGRGVSCRKFLGNAERRYSIVAEIGACGLSLSHATAGWEAGLYNSRPIIHSVTHTYRVQLLFNHHHAQAAYDLEQHGVTAEQTR